MFLNSLIFRNSSRFSLTFLSRNSGVRFFKNSLSRYKYYLSWIAKSINFLWTHDLIGFNHFFLQYVGEFDELFFVEKLVFFPLNQHVNIDVLSFFRLFLWVFHFLLHGRFHYANCLIGILETIALFFPP